MTDKNAVQRLLDIMALLRHPSDGCPWDREQSFHTIAPHTIEEAYEVAEAIEQGDMDGLRDELGDLLFQVVFHSRMAEEMGAFNFDDVAATIAGKLISRHPGVFGDMVVESAAAQTKAWEEQKARERDRKAGGLAGALDGVSTALPALTRAVKLQKRAARVGFDWNNPLEVMEKIREETAELDAEIAAGAESFRLEDELGDLLFSAVNLARKLDIDPERSLRHANAKFERRFCRMEESLGRLDDVSLDEMEKAWLAAKEEEKT